MPLRFEVGPTNVRDVSYIAGNLRDNDKIEVHCQLPEGITAQQIGYICTRPGTSFIAYLDNKPVIVFGFDPVTLAGNVLNAWAFGTNESRKAIHQITLWLKDNMLRNWIKQGVTRIEARSFVEHKDAHKWLKATGAVEEGTLQNFGRNGEQFIQFAWHIDRLKQIIGRLDRYSETFNHVHVKTKNRHSKACLLYTSMRGHLKAKHKQSETSSKKPSTRNSPVGDFLQRLCEYFSKALPTPPFNHLLFLLLSMPVIWLVCSGISSGN